MADSDRPGLAGLMPLWARIPLVMVGYFGLAELGLHLWHSQESIAILWPAAGFLVAALLLSETCEWVLYISGTLLAGLAFNAIHSQGLLLSIISSMGRALEAFIGAWLVRRVEASAPRLHSLKELFVFFCCTAVVGAAAGAAAGSAALAWRQGFVSYLATWRNWWSYDVLGFVVVAPLMIIWVSSLPKVPIILSLRRFGEAILLFGGLGLSAWVVFANTASRSVMRGYLIVPFVLWAALRFSLHGVTLANIVLSTVIINLNSHGFGELAETAIPILDQMLSVRIFLALMAATTLAFATVLAERSRAEEASCTSRQLLEKTFASLSNAIFILDSKTAKIIDCNPAASEVFGYAREEMVGRSSSFLHVSERTLDEFREQLAAAVAGKGEMKDLEFRMKRSDGTVFETEHSVCPLIDRRGRRYGWVSIVRDVSEKKRVQAALKRAEGNLLQSQKMEAVGRLAGGVAHDFNNLLTSIIGYSEILLARPNLRKGVLEDLGEILKSANRAAGLTQQLLAFGRRQMLQPKVISMNEQVLENKRLLDRLIGENIRVNAVLDPMDGRILADPGQLGQVIVNLALNARDAMLQGGTLTIETRCVTLDERYRTGHAELQPGRYVLLSVSDTGQGMSPSVQAHLFEPYFTTKDPGQGSGLGLSTIYGIVKQSGGYIYVDSELGKGSTFKIYLPRVELPLSPAAASVASEVPRGKAEVVVLAEDDEALRRLSAKVLRGYGYEVVEVPDGRTALAASGPASHVDLLITDIIMPEMSGKELAERFERRFPGVRILYISGYTEGVLSYGSVLSQGAFFLQKPFSPQALAIKVRQILDQEDHP